MTRYIALAALWALLALVAACAPQRSTMSTAQNGMIRPSAAYILPDPGGPVVVGAIQRNLGNAVEHEILLGVRSSTPGQNSLSAQVFGRGHQTVQGAVDAGPPTDASVAREMQDVLSGVPMQISPYFVQNRYGPFGYAIGRGKGRDLCIYGWQRLNTLSGSGPFYANRFLIQIRLRLCESGASERDLLQVMYGFTLSSHFGSQYPDMPIVNQPNPMQVLDTGTVVRPATPTGMAHVLPTQAPAPDRAPRAVASAPAAPPAPATAPVSKTASAGPVVPPPTGVERRVADTAPSSSPSAGQAPIVPPPDFAGSISDSLETTEAPQSDLPSPAMQAITAAREIQLPETLAREAVE